MPQDRRTLKELVETPTPVPMAVSSASISPDRSKYPFELPRFDLLYTAMLGGDWKGEFKDSMQSKKLYRKMDRHRAKMEEMGKGEGFVGGLLDEITRRDTPFGYSLDNPEWFAGGDEMGRKQKYYLPLLQNLGGTLADRGAMFLAAPLAGGLIHEGRRAAQRQRHRDNMDFILKQSRKRMEEARKRLDTALEDLRRRHGL